LSLSKALILVYSSISSLGAPYSGAYKESFSNKDRIPEEVLVLLTSSSVTLTILSGLSNPRFFLTRSIALSNFCLSSVGTEYAWVVFAFAFDNTSSALLSDGSISMDSILAPYFT